MQQDAFSIVYLMPLMQFGSFANANILHTSTRKKRGRQREKKVLTDPPFPEFSSSSYFPFSPLSSSLPPPFYFFLVEMVSRTATPQFQSLRKLSQEPVQTPMPSAGTPVQLTLLSWPERTPGESGGKGNERREGEQSARWKEMRTMWSGHKGKLTKMKEN